VSALVEYVGERRNHMAKPGAGDSTVDLKTIENRLDIIAIVLLFSLGLSRDEIASKLHMDKTRVSELVPLAKCRRRLGSARED
jgi:predicted XRE-type DNA-binding protein